MAAQCAMRSINPQGGFLLQDQCRTAPTHQETMLQKLLSFSSVVLTLSRAVLVTITSDGQIQKCLFPPYSIS